MAKSNGVDKEDKEDEKEHEEHDDDDDDEIMPFDVEAATMLDLDLFMVFTLTEVWEQRRKWLRVAAVIERRQSWSGVAMVCDTAILGTRSRRPVFSYFNFDVLVW